MPSVTIDQFPSISKALATMDRDNGWSGMFSQAPKLLELLESYKDKLPEIEKTLTEGYTKTVNDILTPEEIAVDPLISESETILLVSDSMTEGCGNVNDLVSKKYPEWALVDEFLNAVFELEIYHPPGTIGADDNEPPAVH